MSSQLPKGGGGERRGKQIKHESRVEMVKSISILHIFSIYIPVQDGILLTNYSEFTCIPLNYVDVVCLV